MAFPRPRIAVVAHEMEGSSTGVGRYLEGLLSGIAELGGADLEWWLLFKGSQFPHRLWESSDGPFRPCFDDRAATSAVLWEQLRAPFLVRRLGAAAVFDPAYALPGRPRVPSLVTLHDLSFEHLGSEFAFRERWRRRLLARYAARRATRVLTDTGRMAEEIRATYRVPAERLGVVPLAVAERFRPAVPDAAAVVELERLGVRPPYLLAVGAVLPRRRPEEVLRAFAAVEAERPGLRLVLVGPDRLPEPGRLQRLIESSGRRDWITHLEWLPEQLLPQAYRSAELALYVSDYEGYGLPPLEALACGTAAVVSPGLALDDLWPGYPYRCADTSLEAITATLRSALVDPRASREVAAEGGRRVAGLTCRAAAELFLRQVEGVLASPAEGR